MHLIDSHCHLNDPRLAEQNITDIIARAQANGVTHLQTICTRMDKIPELKAIATAHKNVFYSVGVHPHEAGDEGVTYEQLITAAQAPKVIGIGECGLDYYYDNAPREKQQNEFVLHLDAARELNLPLIIHSRDAEQDTIKILEEALKKGSKKILLHCFTSNRQLAEFAWENKIAISASGIITFKKLKELRGIFADTPLELLLVETDSPYLAPEPHRGKVNEPAHVRLVAEKLAELKGISVEQIAKITTQNFFTLFSRAVV